MDEPEIPDGPLEYGYQPRSPFSPPQEMVNLIAQGMEEPAEIAARFGFVGERWEHLSTWKPFLDAVAAQKAELEASGYIFQTKLKWMAADLTEDLYVKARHPDATITQKLETAKFLIKTAGMEPKDEKLTDTAGQITININAGGHKVSVGGPQSTYLDAETAEVSGGYVIAPLIDPSLFVEMAENADKLD